MPMNWKGVAVAAFIPIVLRLLWYHPKLLGGVWERSATLPAEKPRWAMLPLQYGLALVFAFFIASTLMPMVIHQIHVFSTMQGDPGIGKEGSEVMLWLKAFMAEHGHKFRTFKHGALHGALASLFFAIPLLASTALFERRGFKYIAVHGGYWTLSLTLMGALISGWV